MKLAILSGKGGTGKTTFATNLALSLGNTQLLDCDVEEPNAGLFLNIDLIEKESVNIPVPEFNKELCDFCGECVKVCQYNAIAVLPDGILFFPELCHGCGGCKITCHVNAVTEDIREIGIIESGKSNGLEFHQGVLNIGEPLATPIIKALKKKINNNLPVILDAPPGTGCPVIETATGCDYGILVTEPTLFGLHDLKLAVKLMRTLKIPFGIVVNREGIGDSRVDDFCKSEGIEILMKIPQSMEIARLYSKGIPFVIEMTEWKEHFVELFEKISARSKGGGDS